MSTARELLEQADALMRRNRSPPRGEDIPELTDAIPHGALPRAAVPVPAAARRSAAAPTAIDDIPELTEAVEEIEAPSIQEYPDDPDELSRWLQENEPQIPERRPSSAPREAGLTPRVAFAPAVPRANAAVPSESFARLDSSVPPDSIAPPASFVQQEWIATPDSVAPLAERILTEALGHTSEQTAVTRVTEAIELTPIAEPAEERLADDLPVVSSADVVLDDDVFADDATTTITPTAGSTGLPIDTDDPERWKALAEEIRMQVLQRIDIFTDTGLREQLTARLQPVVDRASADLVATINREVGQLLRTYVAEAIEREIEHWRHGGG